MLELFDRDDEPAAARAPSGVDPRPAPVTRTGDGARSAKSTQADVPRVEVSRASVARAGGALAERKKSEMADGSSFAAPAFEALAGLGDAGSSRPRRPESMLSSRSQLMESVRQQAEAEEGVETQKSVAKDPNKKGTKKKKRKKKQSGFFDPKETLKLVSRRRSVCTGTVLAFQAGNGVLPGFQGFRWADFSAWSGSSSMSWALSRFASSSPRKALSNFFCSDIAPPISCGLS